MKKGKLVATTKGKNHSRTVCTYCKMALVKLPRVVSGLILKYINASPKKQLELVHLA